MNRAHWLLPALASLAFFVFTMVVANREGLFGFVVEHSRNGWGAQIFFDLVLSAWVAFSFITPVARRAGMRVAPWLVLLLLTGSIGLLAMVARVLYLQQKVAGRGSAGVSPAQSVV